MDCSGTPTVGCVTSYISLFGPRHRLLVCGSRKWDNYGVVCEFLDSLVKRCGLEVTMVSGGAKGADLLAVRWAAERGHEHKSMPADWNRHRNRAGMIRNLEMLAYLTDTADCGDVLSVVGFRCSGESRGTDHMIEASQAGSAESSGGISVYVVAEDGSVDCL